MFRWQSFHLLPQTNLLQRVRSMHRFNCVIIGSEQCLSLSGFNQVENPTVSVTRVQQQRSSVAHDTNNTNHTVFIKSSRKFPATATSLTLLLLTFLLLGAVFSNSSGSSISRVAIFAFHFSLRARLFLSSAKGCSTPVQFTHDDPAAIISRLNTFAFFPVEMSRCRAMTRWWVGSLNSFHSLFHFGVLSPGVGNK